MVLTPTLLLAGLTALAGPVMPRGGGEIPAFSRKYRVGCTRCHTAAPKLNVLGEAFRLNGYRMPATEPMPRGEDVIPLGEEPWRDLWPRGIWPGELAATVPIAFRLQSELEITRGTDGRAAVNFRFPDDVSLLAASTFGDHIAAFLEVEWTQEAGIRVEEAKAKFQSLIPRLGERAVNLWVGQQSLYLLTFAERRIDRAGRSLYLWQRFRPSDVPLRVAGTQLEAPSQFSLAGTQPAIELNGLITPRFYYAVGLAQGAGTGKADNNRHKDTYYKLRYKFGGMRLDGSFGEGEGPLGGSFGQLLDRSVVIETFGYFGSEPVSRTVDDRHRALGVSARVLAGRLDTGAGYLWGRDEAPWGSSVGALDRRSAFLKVEYLVWPWLLASIRAERFWIEMPAATQAAGPIPSSGFGRAAFGQTHFLPGATALLRQNVRLVLEADLYSTFRSPSDRPAPNGLWLRLDLAF